MTEHTYISQRLSYNFQASLGMFNKQLRWFLASRFEDLNAYIKLNSEGTDLLIRQEYWSGVPLPSLAPNVSSTDLQKPWLSITITFSYWSMCMRAKSLQSCLTLCDPMDCSPPGSSVHRILQARILEWVAMPSSRGSSQRRDRIRVSLVFCIGRRVLYHWHHLGWCPGICVDNRLPWFLHSGRFGK